MGKQKRCPDCDSFVYKNEGYKYWCPRCQKMFKNVFLDKGFEILVEENIKVY